MWVRIKDSGQEVDMHEGPTAFGPGARQLIALGTAVEIEPPKPKAQTTTIGRSAELQSIDRIHDPAWKEANALAYKIGIGNGLADVIFRLIKAEQRIASLEAQIKQENHNVKSTDRERNGKTSGIGAVGV